MPDVFEASGEDGPEWRAVRSARRAGAAAPQGGATVFVDRKERCIARSETRGRQTAMMIFPKKLHQDTASHAEVPDQPHISAQDGERHLPEAWRVVLEDGTTSDDSSTPRAAGTGGKLLAEITEALGRHVDRKGRPSRPRNVAMPASPPQPLHALDDSLQPEGAVHCISKTHPGIVAPGGKRVHVERREPGEKGTVGRSSGTAADQSPGLLAECTDPPRRREIDARLARVIDLWPRLPHGIQVALLAMIEAEATEAR